jgi:hypothetical protein
MAQWYRLSMMALILLVVWGCGKSSSLEGQVVDGRGQPMAKVKMTAKQVQSIKGYEKFETTTGADGRFAFKGRFPSSTYRIFPYWDNQTALVRLKVESGPEGYTKRLPGPVIIRFTRSKDGVITDSATGNDWYVGPDRDINWNQGKTWTESLTAAGGGWRMPTVPELKSLYQKGAGPNNMDPIFQTEDLHVWLGQMIDASRAWAFDFHVGREGSFTLGGTDRLRAFAVRSRR